MLIAWRQFRIRWLERRLGALGLRLESLRKAADPEDRSESFEAFWRRKRLANAIERIRYQLQLLRWDEERAFVYELPRARILRGTMATAEEPPTREPSETEPSAAESTNTDAR